jgi:hypothetical protein
MATTSAPKEVIELVERFDRNRDSSALGELRNGGASSIPVFQYSRPLSFLGG